jgi:hypothetical protein
MSASSEELQASVRETLKKFKVVDWSEHTIIKGLNFQIVREDSTKK